MSDGDPVVIFPRGSIPGLLRRVPGWSVLLVLLVLWLGSGVYQVAQGERGVVLRFGRHDATTDPGLHWHLPWPLETVYILDVMQTRRIEIGFATTATQPLRYVDRPEESLMLTKDENIIDNSFIVQYRVSDPVKFLFNVQNPDQAVKVAAESAMRSVAGSHIIDDILTTEKLIIQEEVKRLLQALMDKYDSGILILNVQLQDVNPPDQVADAFKDVASAREEKQRFINQAESYQNDIIPKARGEAETVIREAEAFKAARIARAQGDASRFLSILGEYRKAPDINRKRLYLEAMEQVLPGVEVYVIDEKVGGVVPYLPLTREGGGPR